MQIVICVHCVHHDTDKSGMHICRRDQSKKINRVTGENDWTGPVRACRDERLLRGPTITNTEPCMAEGVHFKAVKK